MTPLNTVLQAYGAAWRETDTDRRRALLETAFAENGLYSDPTCEVSGRESLVAHIGAVQAGFPGARVELTSKPDVHHDQGRFLWRMVGEDGAAQIEGVDFFRLGSDGRLLEVIGFFGPLTPSD